MTRYTVDIPDESCPVLESLFKRYIGTGILSKVPTTTKSPDRSLSKLAAWTIDMLDGKTIDFYITPDGLIQIWRNDYHGSALWATTSLATLGACFNKIADEPQFYEQYITDIYKNNREWSVRDTKITFGGMLYDKMLWAEKHEGYATPLLLSLPQDGDKANVYRVSIKRDKS